MARLKFEWLCNKTEIFSQWEIPCEGCDRSCEHLTKVSPYRGILGRNREFIFKRDGCCLICGNNSSANFLFSESFMVDYLLIVQI